MPRKKSDATSVETIRAVLEALGCPNPRRAEGTDEWRASAGAYAFTPDLIAGPLVGGGDRSDFYVDVFEPTGDQYIKPKAGNPHAASIVRQALTGQGEFRLSDLQDSGEHMVKTMNDKCVKYVGSRGGNTPMLGLGMYFRMTGNQYAGPVFAAYKALDVLDGAFGITAHRGQATKDRLVQAVMSPGQSAFVVTTPSPYGLAFLLYVVDKVDGVRAIMLVNHGVATKPHEFSDHEVIRWLRTQATDPGEEVQTG
jgi:hypothetical protein